MPPLRIIGHINRALIKAASGMLGAIASGDSVAVRGAFFLLASCLLDNQCLTWLRFAMPRSAAASS